MSFKQPTYVLLFTCCAILLGILISALAASAIVDTVKSRPEIQTYFNFPRYLSDTERAAPAINSSGARYTYVSTNAANRGREINWARILKNGSYDVVIIGDSFLGVPHGKDLCREISSVNNVSVLHIFTNHMAYANGNPFRMATLLANNGFLKKSGARVVILETAERSLPERITASGPLADSIPLPRAIPQKKAVTKKSGGNKPLVTSALNTMNKSARIMGSFVSATGKDALMLKTWIKNDILSVTGSQTNDGSYHFLWLNESRFSSPVYHSRLIFYKNDIEAFHNPNVTYPEDYIRMNNNLNSVSRNLQRQNITLFFMPAVSAYNTYYPYTIDPPTVRNPLFEILRELNHEYVLVDTKAIVSRMQQEGEHDLSGIGDPEHWTWKVTEAIADELDLTAKPENRAGDDSDEYGRAARAFRSVVYERGDHPDAWAYRMDGQIYERVGNYRNAARCYQRSLDLDPRQPGLRARLQALAGV